MNSKECFMKKALDLAKKSFDEGEVPIGAVVVYNNKIIASGRNKREKRNNALHHAEIEAIDKACKKLKSWRLVDCELYVTLEPCPMCAGAIINSRIEKLFIGAKDKKGGAVSSVVNLFDLPFNHKPIVESGILEEECSSILTTFFKILRKERA
jgi:tRNA(adenine34) deaminase